MKLLETQDRVVLEPDRPAQACVIWLHGLGADGHDFVPIVSELRLPDELAIRYVFPHAPVRPVTLMNGMPVRAWFDILSIDRMGAQDVAGITQSQHRIDALVAEQQAAGIASTRVLIAGFSQGGALALQTALRYPQPLAGVLGLSTYLPMERQLADQASVANRGLAILLQHGLYDPVLSHALGTASRDRLRELGYGVGWNEYPMQHEVCAEQLAPIAAFIRERLG